MPDFFDRDGVVLHYAHRPGDGSLRPVVFANSLGTDLRIWDAVVAALPPEVPLLLCDKRGHGLSGHGPTSIAELAADLAALMEACDLRGAIFCGVSVGGLIGQQLAADRPDLVAAAVLSNTGSRIGDAESWNARIAAVEGDGIAAISDAILERWFSGGFRRDDLVRLAGYRAMLERTPARGYAAVCRAIRDAELTARLGEIAQPVICLAGEEDLATPVPLVQALADGLPDAALRVLPQVGHLPCIEAPEAVVTALRDLGAGQ